MQVPLTQNKVALIDDADASLILQYNWFAALQPDGTRWYARSTLNGTSRTISMHVFLSSPTNGLIPDHINGNGLDNRRANLRLATRSQNCWNRQPSAGCASQYKGVSWHKRNRRWYASIRVHGKGKHLGYFDDEIAAALAYDEAARRYHGEFARTNFAQETA